MNKHASRKTHEVIQVIRPHMYKPESVHENETYKIFWDFKI